ncbi:TorD/DmsD family molecular chaperone [Helicobacter sp. 23-1045]
MKRVLQPKNHAQVGSNSALNFGLNQARALYYDFFAGFFLFELLDSRFDLFQKQIDILAISPLNEADLAHFTALKSYLKNTSLADLKREYSQTFDIPFGASGGNLANKNAESKNAESSADFDESAEFERLHKTLNALPKGQIFLYLSHYVEGCLNGASLLKAKQLVKQTRFRLNSDGFKESEEHFGFLLLFMRYLLQDSCENTNLLKSSADSSVNPNAFFNECLRPMASIIADLLIKRDDLPCYYHIGAILAHFIALEEEICS